MSSRTLINSGTPKTTLLSRETQGTHFEYLAFATGNLRWVAGGSRVGRGWVAPGGQTTDDRRQTDATASRSIPPIQRAQGRNIPWGPSPTPI